MAFRDVHSEGNSIMVTSDNVILPGNCVMFLSVGGYFFSVNPLKGRIIMDILHLSAK